MAGQTVSVELLLGAEVRDRTGAPVGRIEEIIAEQEGDELLVREYHTGGYGFLEHLAAITIGAWAFKLLGRRAEGYVIAWDQLDLSEPRAPRLTVPRREVKRR